MVPTFALAQNFTLIEAFIGLQVPERGCLSRSHRRWSQPPRLPKTSRSSKPSLDYKCRSAAVSAAAIAMVPTFALARNFTIIEAFVGLPLPERGCLSRSNTPWSNVRACPKLHAHRSLHWTTTAGARLSQPQQ